MHALSRNNTETRNTILDLRGRTPFHYRKMNRRVAEIKKFRVLEMTFDLNIKKMLQEFMRIPVISFWGTRTRFVFYLNGFGEFGITHHDDEIDDTGEFDTLLRVDLRKIPTIDQHDFQHFRIVIMDDANMRYLAVLIDGHETDRVTERIICPPNQTLTVWWGRADVGAQETITNVLLKYT